MESKRIEELLDKYLEGESSLVEEKELKVFFSQENIPEKWKPYQWQFNFFSKSQNQEQETESLPRELFLDLEEKIINISTQKPAETKQIGLHSKTVQFWTVQIAASVLLVALGFLLGRMGWGGSSANAGNVARNNQLQEIEENVSELKQMLVFSMLKQPSASERIKGVNFTSEMKEPNPQILDVLIITMNSDENVNVRLAAANALLTWQDNRQVRDALIASLEQQDDPVMQIALINMLILLKDKKSVAPIQEFLKNGDIPPKVKDKIREELQRI